MKREIPTKSLMTVRRLLKVQIEDTIEAGRAFTILMDDEVNPCTVN